MDQGQLLVAVPGMLDPNFDATVVYVFDTTDGAAGLILNRPTDIPLSDVLPDLAEAAAAPEVVFHGGPVMVEHGLVLGATQTEITVLDTEAASGADPKSVRVFAGYAGWETGQLEAEIAAGGWFTVDNSPADVLTGDPGGLWRAVFARQSGPLNRYRTYPDDPRLN
ncbi:MAG: YqgE/AlgH family protein [Acidobacteria bacterium]|nr:YqgE/AlgH family protein [Acidobacteriota bacterium]